jgi:GNAT superfamily N-acetyltransferase
LITELQPGDFHAALPLYREAGACFPLILAVLEGSQRGQVFADRRDAPRAAFVVNNFGFALLLDPEGGGTLDPALAGLLREGDALRPSYLLWYAPPARWRRGLDALAPAPARRRERVRMKFVGAGADSSGEGESCPPGFELRRMDDELLPRADKFGLHLGSRFWSSDAQFIEHGMGVCLVKDGEIASLCYAAAVAGGLAEVDVVTDERFRGGGLATFAARRFVEECRVRGLTPAWDCFTYNAGSLKLAEKIGFVRGDEYLFYSFNVPADLAPPGAGGGGDARATLEGTD